MVKVNLIRFGILSLIILLLRCIGVVMFKLLKVRFLGQVFDSVITLSLLLRSSGVIVFIFLCFLGGIYIFVGGGGWWFKRVFIWGDGRVCLTKDAFSVKI